MMQTDVKSVPCPANSSTLVYDGRARLKSLIITTPIGGGTLSIADGADGVILFSLVCQPAVGMTNVLLPGEGILFVTGLFVECPSGLSATVCYG